MPPRTRNVEAIRAVARRIQPVDEIDPYAKVLVLGANGSGKTRFAASAPKVLIIDIGEHGSRSAVGMGAKKIEVETWEDIGHLYWYLHSGKSPYESVSIDTLSGMNNLAMSFVLGASTNDPDPAAERTMPDKRSYGRAGELMKGMMYAFRNLPMHVIFTAQVRVITDDDTGEVVERTVDLPAGSRAVATACTGVTGSMEPQQMKVRREGKVVKAWVDHMRVERTDVMPFLKDKTHNLEPVIRRPTMPQVIEAWQSRQKEQ